MYRLVNDFTTKSIHFPFLLFQLLVVPNIDTRFSYFNKQKASVHKGLVTREVARVLSSEMERQGVHMRSDS